MRADRVARRFATPITAPASPPGAYRFIDREYLNIVYRFDPDALREVVPEPLQIDDPLVRVEIMHMGDVGGYGRTEQGALIGTLDVSSERVATATMGYKYRELDADEARRQIGAPTYMLKVVRGYGARPMVCDLVRTQITDVVVKGAWTGPARLQLNARVLAPLADLPVLEIVDVRHILTGLTLAGVGPVHNYLEAAQ